MQMPIVVPYWCIMEWWNMNFIRYSLVSAGLWEFQPVYAGIGRLIFPWKDQSLSPSSWCISGLKVKMKFGGSRSCDFSRVYLWVLSRKVIQSHLANFWFSPFLFEVMRRMGTRFNLIFNCFIVVYLVVDFFLDETDKTKTPGNAGDHSIYFYRILNQPQMQTWLSQLQFLFSQELLWYLFALQQLPLFWILLHMNHKLQALIPLRLFLQFSFAKHQLI